MKQRGSTMRIFRMVRNHPSVAIWATSDEEDLENYRVLTKHLAGRLFAGDHERRAVVRSTGRYGDGHIYYGWYGGNIWQYTTTEEQFISELGATALPNYETLMQFLPNHWPIEDHKEEWIFRKLQISEAMQAWGLTGRQNSQGIHSADSGLCREASSTGDRANAASQV